MIIIENTNIELIHKLFVRWRGLYMNFLDYVLVIYFIVNLIFAILFLLYQFDILDIPEEIMIHWCRFFSICETVILITTRFFDFGTWGAIGIGAFYILNIILLVLQFIFAEFGAGRKILDILWIAFYVMLFLVDICNISTMQIIEQFKYAEELKSVDAFLSESFLGKLIISIIAPVCRGLIVEAINREEYL